LQQLRTAQQIAELRGKEVEQIVGRRLANVYRKAEGKAEATDGTAGAAETANGETK
jgi:hypothetical protein